MQSYVLNVHKVEWGGWTAEMIWGFEKTDDAGERRYVRRVVVRDRSGRKVERARLVYDYVGQRQGARRRQQIPEKLCH